VVANEVDLEILLTWVPKAGGFIVTILYNAPGDRDDDRYLGREPVQIDVRELDDARSSPDEYGKLLGAMVFPEGAAETLRKALAASRNAPLHLRAVIDPHAPPAYQAIRWETICEPDTGLRLTTSQNIRFSRFMTPARGNQPTLLARMGIMKALVVVANPSGVGNYAGGAGELEPIDVETELVRARSALGHMSLTELPREGRRATRSAIIEDLSTGIHVLYLVCHGRIGDGDRPELLLEDADGGTAVVDGTAFANDVGSLNTIPTVIVLCSCASAGSGRVDRPAGDSDEGPRMSSTAEKVAAVGPALAYAGATVVIGMLGDLTMQTAGLLLPRFFTELKDHGVPSRAMAEARRLVADRPDWYMPVLYSRLKRGSAWYEERFGSRGPQLFANLQKRITNRHCTPVVGSGIAGEDGLLPSREELAVQWVTRRQMPISDASRGDLAAAAQFVRVEQEGGVSLARDEMHDLLLGELKERHGRRLPELDFDAAPLHTLIGEIGRRHRREAGGTDAYSRLARLNLPVYVTTSWTGLLEDTLAEQGHPPVVRHFDWRKSTSVQPWPYEPLGPPDDDVEREWEQAVGVRASDGQRFQPTWETPLVYHLSGTLEHERTLVLTEDDYFAWLQEWLKQVDNGTCIPGFVKTPLITNSQLFLGYHFDDWEFRMMFQAIKSFQRSLRTDDDGPHVGVQFEPTTLRIDREAAQAYLENYFEVDKINIYWQSCTDFLTELEASRRS
jgi:CHAT domain/SIR2-like domain